jgi:hypothetical protein
MNNKISNPYLKQLISEISNKTAEGRITGVSWSIIEEAKKKKKIKEADKKKETPADEKDTNLPSSDTETDKATDSGSDKVGGLPPLGGTDETPKDANAGEGGDTSKTGAAPEADSKADADKAEADAAEAKAKLEKAKAEKDQAEKELKDQAYVKLGSSSGTEFLLGKVLNTAFKTNTIDALAREMVQKLKIQTVEDMNLFSEEVAPYMTIPGMADLITSMKPLATKQSETPTEEPKA